MRAILFDVNGTLLNSREHVFWQFEQLTKHFDGAPATRQEIARAMHGTVEEVIRTLVKNQNTPFSEIKNQHLALRQQAIERTQPFDGVAELLPILQRLGFRLAAITTGGDHRLHDVLDRHGLTQYFDIIVTDKHVAAPHPDPQSVLYALKHMGIAPELAVVVGDTHSDMKAGRSAGVAKTIGVLHGVRPAEELHAAGAHYVIDDIPALLDIVE